MSTVDEALARLAAAKRDGDEVVIAIAPSGAAAILLTRRTTADPAEHLDLEACRQLGKLKTARPIRDAIRSGELVAFGKQRSRVVKRGDLLAWLEARRVRPVAGIDDRDIARRVERLAKSRKPKRRTP
jgi:hypothetical protein